MEVARVYSLNVYHSKAAAQLALRSKGTLVIGQGSTG
jgi:hypothetical protein